MRWCGRRTHSGEPLTFAISASCARHAAPARLRGPDRRAGWRSRRAGSEGDRGQSKWLGVAARPNRPFAPAPGTAPRSRSDDALPGAIRHVRRGYPPRHGPGRSAPAENRSRRNGGAGMGVGAVRAGTIAAGGCPNEPCSTERATTASRATDDDPADSSPLLRSPLKVQVLVSPSAPAPAMAERLTSASAAASAVDLASALANARPCSRASLSSSCRSRAAKSWRRAASRTAKPGMSRTRSNPDGVRIPAFAIVGVARGVEDRDAGERDHVDPCSRRQPVRRDQCRSLQLLPQVPDPARLVVDRALDVEQEGFVVAPMDNDQIRRIAVLRIDAGGKPDAFDVLPLIAPQRLAGGGHQRDRSVELNDLQMRLHFAKDRDCLFEKPGFVAVGEMAERDERAEGAEHRIAPAARRPASGRAWSRAAAPACARGRLRLRHGLRCRCWPKLRNGRCGSCAVIP